jgi:ABC-type branched-subunit amino acid transport system substrate-binding protein
LTRLRSIAIALTLPLVIAACGRSSTNTATPSSDNGGGTGTTVAGSQAGLDQGGFGDLGVICKKASDPSALKATDVGVKADEIDVTTFSDPGFSGAKGLNQEMFDTAVAFANWCNKFGGINGRKIKVTLADGKLFESEQRMVEACDAKTFMAVGGGSVFDDTMQKDRMDCSSGAIPQVAGYLVTATASDSELTKQPVPNPGTTQPVGAFLWLKKTFPDTWDHIGVLTGQLPTTEVVAKRNEEALATIGGKVVYSGEYPPAGTDNWRPYVAAMQSKGVRGLYWVGQPQGLAQMLSAAKGLGLKLDWVQSDANHYDDVLFKNANPVSAVDGVTVRSAFAPFLSGVKMTTATQQYVDMVQQYDTCTSAVVNCTAEKKIAYLGDQALSAWLLWAKATDSCGADVTRDCVWAALDKVQTWTGGGLHAETFPGSGKASPCFIVFLAKNGKFTQPDISPTDGIYNCDEQNIVPLKKNYGAGAKCPNPAYKSDPKPSTCGK